LQSVFGIAFLKVLFPSLLAFWFVTYQRIESLKAFYNLSAKFWTYGVLGSTFGVSIFWSQIYAFYYGSISANSIGNLSDLIIFFLILPSISAYLSYSLLKKFKKELNL
jgi:hypothetical protein